MKTYKVDLDYEASLFDPRYKEEAPASHKIIREFEYVFFLVQKEKSILKNIKSYEKKYLDYLRDMGFVIPSFDPEATQYEYWWGHHHNKELEQRLNSKLTSASVARENNWGFQEGAIVETLEQLKSHLKKFSHLKKWIIKRPHGFSGIGHYQFHSLSLDENILSKILTEKVLLEPEYDRVFDIGTTFVITDGVIERQFMVENFNSSSGGFKGGAGSSNVDKFKKYICQKYSYSLNELESIAKKIAEKYLEMGAESNIQIDSFVYREDNELKLYALVEVNYRKTMGLVIQSLAEKYPEAGALHWKIEPVKNLKNSPLDHEWKKISPEGNHFHSFFRPIYLS
ncbi:MAG: hypothetical protein ACXVCE_03535 [Bacteriovorax sp.]